MRERSRLKFMNDVWGVGTILEGESVSWLTGSHLKLRNGENEDK